MSVGEICARGVAQEYIPSRRIMDSANLALRAKPHGSTTSLQMDSLGTPTAVQHDETTLSTSRELATPSSGEDDAELCGLLAKSREDPMLSK